MAAATATLERLVEDAVLEATGASRIVGAHVVQSLWSGYGHILRVAVEGAPSSVIVKRVRWPTAHQHPRGWATDRSHERKVKSYAVEASFYREVAALCDAACRVPQLLSSSSADDGVLLVLEDLDAAGFDGRRRNVTPTELRACLSWLAAFHATFLGHPPGDLWTTGTYWHLATRPDELAAIGDARLARAAPALDRRLSDARLQTLVHGDAKLANFCFAADGAVAAVDFQYVGGGCGIKDVAYFLGSCLDEEACDAQEDELLAVYFDALRSAIAARRVDVDIETLVDEWRGLYPVAWTDFYRFLAGWSPGHWKVHAYTRRLAREVLATLPPDGARA
jgi:hypothetical protein